MRNLLFLVLLVLCHFNRCFVVHAEEIKAAEIKHDGPVDFHSEIIPILRKNCLACHNQTDAESDLILESPQQMIKGGSEGASLIPGNADASFLVKVASHQEDPIMPPEDNDVGAKPLTPEELALLKLWINQGAKGDAITTAKIKWQPLPKGINPVFSVATSFDGQFVAAGRANQIFLHLSSTGKPLGRLSDDSLVGNGVYEQPGVAHLDMVQSLAFSPNGEWIASGGYRTAKLWRRASRHQKQLGAWENAAGITSVTSGVVTVFDSSGKAHQIQIEDGTQKSIDLGLAEVVEYIQLDQDAAAAISADGKIKIVSPADGAVLAEQAVDSKILASARLSENSFASAHEDKKVRFWSWDGSAKALTQSPHVLESAQEIQDIAAQGALLALGTADGNVILFQISDQKKIRQVNHGAKIAKVAITATQVFSTGENGIIKIWNLSDGKLVTEIKHSQKLSNDLAQAQFDRDVANRQVNNAKKDLDESNKRVKQEEDNLKKSEERKKKAVEEKGKKEEASKKAADEKTKSESAVKDLETKVAAATKVIQDSEKQIAASITIFDQALSDLAKIQPKYAALTEPVVAAQMQLMEAKKAAEKDKENKDLASAVAAADAALKKAISDRNGVESQRQKTFAIAQQQEETRTRATAAMEAHKKAVAESQKALAPAKKQLDEKTKAAEKVANELKDATRSLESAESSVQQAKKAMERSKSEASDFQKSLDSQTAIAKQKEESFQAAEKSQNEFRFQAQEIDVSADGEVLAVTNKNGHVYLFSTKTGSYLSIIELETPITRTAFDSTDRLVTIGKTMDVWNVYPRWTLAKTIGSPNGDSILSDRITALSFSPDSTQLAVGGGQPSRNGELKIFDVATGELKADLKDTHSDTVLGIDFSPDGKLLATSAADRFMKVSDLESQKVIKSFEGHTHHVLSVSWQADGRVLATAGADKVVKLWNYREGTQIRTISGFGKEVTSLQHMGPNDAFVAVSGDHSIYSCNQGGARNGIGKGKDFLYCVSVSQIGETIAFAGHDSVVQVIDPKGKVISSLEPPK